MNPAHVDPRQKWTISDAFGPATRSCGTQNDTAPAAFDDTTRLRSRFLVAVRGHEGRRAGATGPAGANATVEALSAALHALPRRG